MEAEALVQLVHIRGIRHHRHDRARVQKRLPSDARDLRIVAEKVHDLLREPLGRRFPYAKNPAMRRDSSAQLMAEEPDLEGDGDEEGKKIGGGLAHGDAGEAEQPRQQQDERHV